jgi:hypothetical protein
MKTIIIIAFLALGTTILLFGNDLGSVAGTAIGKSRQSAEEAMGLDFLIDRAEHALGQADAELVSGHRRVAEMQVKKEDLTNEFETLKNREHKYEVDIATLTEMYKATGLGQHSAVFQGKSIDGAKVEVALQLAHEKLSFLRRTLEAREGLIGQYGSSLEDSREHVATMEFTKEQLTLQAETMQFELEAVSMSEALAGVSVNGSFLSEAQGLISQVSEELRVRKVVCDDRANPIEALLGSSNPVGEALVARSSALTAGM